MDSTIVRKEGAERLLRRVARLPEEWVIRETRGPLSLADRARRAEAIAGVLGKIQNRIERDLYIRMAAERLAVDERLMREATARDPARAPGTRAETPNAASGGPPAAAPASAAAGTLAIPDAKIGCVEEEFRLAFSSERAFRSIRAEETLATFTSPPAGAAALLRDAGTAAAAALVDRPDPAIVLGHAPGEPRASIDDRAPLAIFARRVGAGAQAGARDPRPRARCRSANARASTPRALRRKADLTRELGRPGESTGAAHASGSRE
jgi:hypothetical protein